MNLIGTISKSTYQLASKTQSYAESDKKDTHECFNRGYPLGEAYRRASWTVDLRTRGLCTPGKRRGYDRYFKLYHTVRSLHSVVGCDLLRPMS